MYDRSLRLEADTQSQGGMLAKLHVGPARAAAAAGGGSGQPPVAVNDVCSGAMENTPYSGCGSVLANDTSADPITGAVLVAQASAGTRHAERRTARSATRRSPHFAGVDQFSYRAREQPTAPSNIATVTINVANTPDRPIATPGALTLNVKEGRTVTVGRHVATTTSRSRST